MCYGVGGDVLRCEDGNVEVVVAIIPAWLPLAACTGRMNCVFSCGIKNLAGFKLSLGVRSFIRQSAMYYWGGGK